MPARLAELGWRIRRIAEEFDNDAQAVPDEEWVEFGLVRGWVPLCKDGRIKGRAHEREPLERLSGVLFYLNNQSLRIDAMVDRIHRARADVHRAVARGGPAVYAITDSGIARTWP
ncbi:toxin-antitoxin system, toxin component, PIN family protein [Streptomyces sp. DSM 42041]|uniref:Toxin-antitoxin system, toxin component, PIN family protein n=1 Tax=Streptomyces hazeniae TaxID=3075538 RepID=A0ABU2NW07_9ACTN|nr:toxin-antitoxin system, toxin component, PIN family protein [Streptomyces sp. DSM 42041]MDT0380781.1 toxin-antitoxin system, toxin component, PIN family protein [Streptomyces sp. DSM 42041]